MIVEAMLLGDLVRSLLPGRHVNGELIRVDGHRSRSWSRLGSRAGQQQRAHHQQCHSEDHVAEDAGDESLRL